MKTNVLIATLVLVLLSAWMIVGSILANGDPAPETPAETRQDKPLPSVRYRDSVAEPYLETVTLRGKTEASRSSVLKAETDGPVAEIVAPRGSRVEKGAVLIRLDPQSLHEQLEAAQALADQRQLEHEAAQKLQSSGYQSQTRLAEAASLLASARNQLAATRIALENTEIRAPFDGVFNERLVEVGEFVAVGDPVANFLALNPLIVSAEATEREIQKIQRGAHAVARIGDDEVEGVIRYLSYAANDAVRTYTVELEFDNSEHKYEAGLTADIVADAQHQMAHKVSPALLFLSANTEGDLGLKTVDPDDTVHFYRTQIIGSADDGVWVSGLPDEVRLITVGQGYVLPGAKVKPVDEATIQ